MVAIIVQGLIIALPAVAAYLLLRGDLTRNSYRASAVREFGAVAHELRMVLLNPAVVRDDDRWLAQCLLDHIAWHSEGKGLRVNLDDLHRRAHEDSRDRMLFLRRIARCERNTRNQKLRESFRRVLRVTYMLAAHNTRETIAGRLKQRAHRGHAEERGPAVVSTAACAA